MGIRNRIHAWWAKVRSEHSDPPRFGAAVALGVFIGVVPIYGFQILTALALSRLLRLNSVTVVAAAHISTPPIGLLWIVGGVAIGDFLRFGEVNWITTAQAWQVMDGTLREAFVSCLLGSVVLGAIVAVPSGWWSYRWALRRVALELLAEDPEPKA